MSAIKAADNAGQPGAPVLSFPARTLSHILDNRWAIASILSGLLLWEFISRVIVGSTLFLAAPTQVFGAMVKLARTGELQYHMWVSGLEFVIGYVGACILGIAVGMLISSSAPAKQALQPWISGLYATPTVALAPLFILWFGVGIVSKIVVVAILVVFPVIINTETGLRTTSTQLVEMVRSFGASRRQVFLKVALPSALPFIFAGLRLGIGRGLIGVVVAELFGARAGLGQLISQSAETFNMPELFAGVSILALSGILLTSGFQWLEGRLLPWKE
ncbi:putative aliphatic sulfonates transport permease protein SsuC [Hartmannibacter diazotrophicus]|uniref:Putative aliphatic sulfonates transport permease protein SsuC n=1 Tax=Hartmannibacter diazotrophicus TaxID=1482074 RepID=A0A2C9D155_9HYPH|nr:ABC transporter permease [Hartmannibacter diazotrophicus]SON54052.1 putative aliphatic sulfonates transport permease protein SsuC [Hartmannibacter diazotrophicus]